MNVLASTVYFTLSHDAGRQLLTLTRSGERLATEQIDVVFEPLLSALAVARLPLGDERLLVDLRQGPANNDPQFEVKMNLHMKEFVGRFARCAVLVRTAVGLLQVTRLVRPYGDSVEAAIFRDEAEAFAFLAR